MRNCAADGAHAFGQAGRVSETQQRQASRSLWEWQAIVEVGIAGMK